MIEQWEEPHRDDDVIGKGQETLTVTYRITSEQRNQRADDALAKEESVEQRVVRAKAELKAATDAEKAEKKDARKIRESNRQNVVEKPGRVAKFHDYREKTRARYPLGRLVLVRLGGKQDGEVVQEQSRELTDDESKIYDQAELTLADPTPAFENVVAECIKEGMTDRPEGRLVTDLVEWLTTAKGFENVTPEMVRDIVSGDDRYTLDTNDAAMLAPEPGDRQEDAERVAEAIQAEIVSSGTDGVSVEILAANMEAMVGFKVAVDAVREIVEGVEHLTITDNDRVVRVAAIGMREGAGAGNHSIAAPNHQLVPDRHIATRAIHLLKHTNEGRATVAKILKMWTDHDKLPNTGQKWGDAPTKKELVDSLTANAEVERKHKSWNLVTLTQKQEQRLADKSGE